MMRSRFQRIVLTLVTAVAVGRAAQFGCASFAGEQFLRVVDFCFLFDCQNGALGGLINPCPDTTTSTTTTTDDTTTSDNLFVDCPPVDDGTT